MQLAARMGNWKVDLGRVVGFGLASLVALTAMGWPDNAAEAAWIALVGGIVGLLLVFVVEYVVRLHAEVNRLHSVEATLEADRHEHTRLVKLLEHRAQVAQAESTLNGIYFKVWSEAYRESESMGQFVPFEALMARVHMQQKVAGLDKPIPPPKLD